jgi:hypothetical protein
LGKKSVAFHQHYGNFQINDNKEQVMSLNVSQKVSQAFTHAVGTVYLRVRFGHPKAAAKFLNDWDNNSLQEFPKPMMNADEVLSHMARAGYKPITRLSDNERKCMTRGEEAVCSALSDISFYGEITGAERHMLSQVLK